MAGRKKVFVGFNNTNVFFKFCQQFKKLIPIISGVYADLCRFYGMVSNKWYNEAKPILDYIVCPIGIPTSKREAPVETGADYQN